MLLWFPSFKLYKDVVFGKEQIILVFVLFCFKFICIDINVIIIYNLLYFLYKFVTCCIECL